MSNLSICTFFVSLSKKARCPKEGRLVSIADWKKDEWSGFADLLANLIEKYAVVLDIDNLPEPPHFFEKNSKENVNSPSHLTDSIDKADDV